jgi:YVTN family beta-propeller protein
MRVVSTVSALLLAAALPAVGQTVLPSIAAGSEPRAVAVDAALNRIYVANHASNNVTVLDGASGATFAIAVGQGPSHVAVNPVTSKVYVSNVRDGSTSVIDPGTNAVTPILTGGSGVLSIDETRNRIYNTRTGKGDEANVIFGDTNHSYAMALESYGPVDLEVNPATNRLYVASYISGQVASVNLELNTDYPHPKQIGVWSKPVALALNRATNKIYVIVDDARGPIGIIDGATDTAISLKPEGHAQGPRAVAVNSRTNKVYAAFTNEVVVIDGASNALSFIPVTTGVAVAIDESRNKILVPSATGSLAVIDGATNALTTVAIPAGATDVAVNATTGIAYVVGTGGITPVQLSGAASPAPQPTPSMNVQGLWWASPPGSESGWGVNLTQQGEILFGTWFTYDKDGSGMWLVMSNGAKTGTNSWSGPLYRTTGPAYSSTNFDASKVAHTSVGSASFAFSDANNGTFTVVVDGVTMTKAITRQLFATPAPTCATGAVLTGSPNYQDLWWKSPAGSESGWGVNIAHQGTTLFVTWFTYGADGKGLWLVGSNVARTGPETFSGPLQKISGPAWNAIPWNPNTVSRLTVGSVSIQFSDAANGTMTYTVDGITQTKPITRQVYSGPPTVCQ